MATEITRLFDRAVDLRRVKKNVFRKKVNVGLPPHTPEIYEPAIGTKAEAHPERWGSSTS